jgi:hypothetical protein
LKIVCIYNRESGCEPAKRLSKAIANAFGTASRTMRKHNIFVASLLISGLVSGLLGTSVAARAQSASQTPAGQASDANTPSAPAPSTKDKSKQDKAKQQSTPPANAAPDTPQAPAPKPSTAEDNPFPEDVSRQAAAAAKAEAHDTATPDAPAPASSAEKQAQGSSSLDNTDKLGLDDPTRRQLKLESPDGTTDVYDPKRATEDVKVGKFYLQTGYIKGAYDRFKDATTFDHENVDAVFYLAEAARKLNLAQEAEQNYQLYLTVVPDGPTAKAARKALDELGSSSKP